VITSSPDVPLITSVPPELTDTDSIRRDSSASTACEPRDAPAARCPQSLRFRNGDFMNVSPQVSLSTRPTHSTARASATCAARRPHSSRALQLIRSGSYRKSRP
jgi:hypothetical protein